MAKKKKPYKYLKMYHELMKTGLLKYSNGLCTEFYEMGNWEEEYKFLNLFKPESPKVYWADDDDDVFDMGCKFNPLRQTIVLFMAAMNNEL